ncbi:hypothetical protein BDV96DRAFT_456384, partial [Lophiotrema nucula]
MVTIVVGKGDKQKSFNLYKDVLTFHSTYFRNALKHEWVEGQSKIITLTEDDPDVFQIFSYWLFSKRLYHPDPAIQASDLNDIPLTFRRICEIYVLGDMRGIPELCNATLDLFFAKMMAQWVFPCDQLNHVYDNTPDKSPLRQLCLDDYVKWGSVESINADTSSYPKDFLVDLIIAAKKEK